jgi:photosystem II stability/assembly factor-like uncharacterized protein
LDGGEHWDITFTLESGYATAISIDPRHRGVAYAATSNGVLKTTDRGESWSAAQPAFAGKPVLSVAVSPSGSAIYAGTWHAGMFRSRDAGATWEETNSGFSGALIWALAVDPNNRRVALAGGPGGLFRTDDAGASWTFNRTGLETTGAIESLAFDANSTAAYVAAQFPCSSAFPCIPGGPSFAARTAPGHGQKLHSRSADAC